MEEPSEEIDEVDDDNTIVIVEKASSMLSIVHDEIKIQQAFKKRVPIVQKSLSIFIVAYQGKYVVFELKNGIEIGGTIDECDYGMNTTLTGATQISPSGKVRQMDIAYVNGKNILYVHFPKETNPIHVLTEYVSRCCVYIVVNLFKYDVIF